MSQNSTGPFGATWRFFHQLNTSVQQSYDLTVVWFPQQHNKSKQQQSTCRTAAKQQQATGKQELNSSKTVVNNRETTAKQQTKENSGDKQQVRGAGIGDTPATHAIGMLVSWNRSMDVQEFLVHHCILSRGPCCNKASLGGSCVSNHCLFR